MKAWQLVGSAVLAWVSSLSAMTAAGHPAHEATRSNALGFVFDGRIIDAIEFFKPHDGGNGRSYATCHRPEDRDFGLTPATVEARYQLLQARRRVHSPAADDPLFQSIDADDLDQDFTTLRTKGLIRVTLPLALNVTLADDPTARFVTVWRSVPSVIARITAPFQAEGRLGTLPEQALAAMREHSEVTQDVDGRVLRRLARFQEHLFSSGWHTEAWPTLSSRSGPLPTTDPPLNRLERQGKATFTEFCGTPSWRTGADPQYGRTFSAAAAARSPCRRVRKPS